MTHDENVKVTQEQHEIAELASPLAKYLTDKDMVCAVVLVTMNGVALYWEGFAGEYENEYTKIVPPRHIDFPYSGKE